MRTHNEANFLIITDQFRTVLPNESPLNKHNIIFNKAYIVKFIARHIYAFTYIHIYKNISHIVVSVKMIEIFFYCCLLIAHFNGQQSKAFL